MCILWPVDILDVFFLCLMAKFLFFMAVPSVPAGGVEWSKNCVRGLDDFVYGFHVGV